jgi:hypothetical protein
MSETKNETIPEIIRKKERNRVVIKFTPEKLNELENQLTQLLKEKFKNEQAILQAKECIKDLERKTRNLSELFKDGGESENVVCDVEIYPAEKLKKYFYNGELVETEEMSEYDLQMEIEELNEESEKDEESEENDETE